MTSHVMAPRRRRGQPVFGTPGDVTVAELAIEALYPADAATRALLGRN